MLIGYVSSVSFFVSVACQATEKTLAVGAVTEENRNSWEDVELLDEDRDMDPEVWMVLNFYLDIRMERDYMRTDVGTSGTSVALMLALSLALLSIFIFSFIYDGAFSLLRLLWYAV